MQREVFGPVLHIIRYKYGQLEQLLEQINAKGYGLTMGLHTRIDETIQTVIAHAEVGNLYINRNIVGAVVGVQPFGGEGLSGTGPKAGGPISPVPFDAALLCEKTGSTICNSGTSHTASASAFI